jgi:hypothetical protein
VGRFHKGAIKLIHRKPHQSARFGKPPSLRRQIPSFELFDRPTSHDGTGINFPMELLSELILQFQELRIVIKLAFSLRDGRKFFCDLQKLFTFPFQLYIRMRQTI